MAVHTQLMTAEELLRLPLGEWRYELVNGELRRMAPSGFTHGTVAAEVGARLTTFVREHGLGRSCAAETGFFLRRDPDTVRAPDAAFISTATLERASPTAGFFPAAPDMAVEVISPSDTYTKVEEKVAEWLAAGTKVVVVLDPERRAGRVYGLDGEIVTLGATDTLSVPDLLPGWSLPLAEIFG
jgi:Uma2 family endonuclease